MSLMPLLFWSAALSVADCSRPMSAREFRPSARAEARLHLPGWKISLTCSEMKRMRRRGRKMSCDEKGQSGRVMPDSDRLSSHTVVLDR